jgi:hypothetical protein
LALFHVTSKLKVKNLRRQFLDRVETPLVTAKRKREDEAGDIAIKSFLNAFCESYFRYNK